MSISVVSPYYMFGATVTACKNTIDFVNNATVVYPAGASLVLYDTDQRSQTLIIGTSRSRPLTALAVTPNRRYIAVAEQAINSDSENTDFQPIVTVYDAQVRVHFIDLLSFLWTGGLAARTYHYNYCSC